MSFSDAPHDMPCLHWRDLWCVGGPCPTTGRQRAPNAFGQRLAAVRRSKGLSQRELAKRLNVTREMIDYYERRAPNPALDFIERAAAALEVSVAELLGSQPHTMRAKPGPVSQLERRMEQVKLLPRKKQQLVIEFLDAIISTEQA